MTLERISEDILFQTNTKEELLRWCPQLQYFHYLRARGGHNCEGDSFYVSFLYDDLDDLVNKLKGLGVTLQKIPEGSIPFDPMARYSLFDLDRIRNVVPGTKEWEQPGFVTIEGNEAHIWVMNNHFTISISGTKKENKYVVDEDDFLAAKAIESKFNTLDWLPFIDKNIIKETHCVSRERYPELF